MMESRRLFTKLMVVPGSDGVPMTVALVIIIIIASTTGTLYYQHQTTTISRKNAQYLNVFFFWAMDVVTNVETPAETFAVMNSRYDCLVSLVGSFIRLH